MKTFKKTYLERAHQHTKNNYHEVLNGVKCCCFYCFKQFPTMAILLDKYKHFFDNITVTCPFCGIDSVLGERAGFPVDDIDFIEAMGLHFFDGYAKGHEKFDLYEELLTHLDKRFKIIK